MATISIFGAQASDDFWLLVQHQPLAVQDSMLPAMRRATENGEAAKRNYAYLFDRFRSNKENCSTGVHSQSVNMDVLFCTRLMT
jgi:hypothetical protein